MTNLLEEVYILLLIAMTSDKLPSDCALITATSLCIVVSQLKRENMKFEFLNVLSTLNKILMVKDRKDTEQIRKQVSQSCIEGQTSQILNAKYQLQGKFDDIQPSYPVVLVLYGLFNSGLQWVYDIDRKCKVPCLDLKAELIDKHMNESSLDDYKTSECTDILQPVQGLEHRSNDSVQDGSVFLYEIYPLLNKLCRSATSYTFQMFQVRKVPCLYCRKD